MSDHFSAAPPACPFRIETIVDLPALRQTLEAVGYTHTALARSVGTHDGLGRMDMSLMLRRTQAQTPYHSLVRLFFLGQPVPVTAVSCALDPVSLESLIAVGLLKRTTTDLRAEAMLIPTEEFLIIHDFPAEVTGRPEMAEYVLGVGRASITLANLTVRRQGEIALDLGTGSGFQALLAARHAAEVVATDVNPRALNFAGLNTRLNGLSNIRLRQGSLYEPVHDQQFDLIMANPPFVISPEARYLYRDSELRGDRISELVIRGAPAHLREDGYAIVLCNWHHQGEDWAERLRPWVTENGCDAWLLCFKSDDPLTYAATWLRPTEGRDQQQYGDLLDAWMDYYRELGIERISYGAVILRRRSGRTNWVRADTVLSGQGVGSCSTQIQHIFATQDFLEDLTDERQLLDCVLVLTPDHQMEHVLKAEEGGWTVTDAILKSAQGLQFTGRVDRMVSAVLAGCDGQHPLRELAADVAYGLGIEFEAVAPSCLHVVRKLMQTGFLRIAETP